MSRNRNYGKGQMYLNRLGIVLATAAGGILLVTVAVAAMSGDTPLRGDLNCDGVVDFDDVEPFSLAVNEPENWSDLYGHDRSHLLQIADFDEDGDLDLDDIPGFSAILADILDAPLAPTGSHDSAAINLAMGSLSGGKSGVASSQSTGPVDLDIDSDNDADGTSAPARTEDEDTIEDDPYLPGKQIKTEAADRTRAVLEFEATGATELTDLDFRLTFPPELDLAIPAYYHADYPEPNYPNHEKPEQPLDSRQTNQYPYPYWILGDMNDDGSINSLDISPYVLAITEPAQYEATYGKDAELVGDINGDWAVNSLDTDPFVALVISGERRPIPVRLLAEGQTASDALGETRIKAEADTDDDGTFEPDTEIDAVRSTVWNGTDLPMPAELGSPPAWGGGLAISPFSTVNLRSGNVLTAIPLVSWDPVGPPVSFTLYHNSQGSPYSTDYSAWGFDLGDGWSVSYGSHIVGDPNDATVVVVEADGQRNVYVLENGVYESPAGVHDLLEWDDAESEWVLTSPGQWRLIFDAVGRLCEIHDSAGNVSTVVRDSGNDYRIDYVASAADGLTGVGQNRLDFSYNGSGTLNKITDAIGREWIFLYEAGQTRLNEIEYPHDQYVDESSVVFSYEAGNSNRIEDITSRDELTWTYTYTGGELEIVHDPNHQVDQQTVRYTQSFEYADELEDGLWETTYTDRRGYDWLIRFDGLGNNCEAEDPLTHTQSWSYDAEHNRTESTDELGHTWTTTYGPVGNVLTVSSPLTGAAAQTWTYEWLPPEPNEPGNLYRLEKVSDPLNHWVEYDYADAVDPTLVTAITEQPALGSDPNDATVTTLQYYSDDPNDIHARGQLGLVIDANRVHHCFGYDKWGYLYRNEDGLIEEARTVVPPWPGNGAGPGTSTNDGCGRATGVSGADGTETTGTDTDANGNKNICGYIYRRGEAYFTRLGDPPSPRINTATVCFDEVEYDVVGRLQYLNRCYYGADARVHEIEYDDLKRPISMTSGVGAGYDYPSENPEGIYWELERTTIIDEYDADGRPLTITGPDDEETEYTFDEEAGYDELGRPETVARGEMSTTFTYDEASRVEQVDYGNGTKIVYQYDNADRLLYIEHRDLLNLPMLRIDYEWNRDNTIASRTEADVVAGETVIVTFSYDNRRRLIGEARVVNSTTVYDILYTYDQLGNRLSKIDYGADPDRKTLYYYDSDPNNRDPNYVTNNNRLLWYEDYVDDGQSGWDLIRTVNYTYYQVGHVSNITIKDEYPDVGDPNDYEWYRDLAFYYNSNHELWRVLWDRWKVDGQGEHTNYEKLAAREFYYDSPRQRHMWRNVDPNEWLPLQDPNEPTHAEHWTDYMGEMPYGDFDMLLTDNDPNYDMQVDEQTRYLTAAGLNAQQTVVDPNTITYFHGDLIDSTMMTTDSGATAVTAVSYTAFGEPIGDPNGLNTRYQYAGGYGYESDLLTLDGVPGSAPITLQHVGARWYQPDIGRFVQRDLIGIRGGFNLYLYCGNNPLTCIDPAGLLGWGGGLPESVWIDRIAMVWGPPINFGFDNWDDLFREIKEARRLRMWNLTRWRNTGNKVFYERMLKWLKRFNNLYKQLPKGPMIVCAVWVGAGYAGAAAGHAAERHFGPGSTGADAKRKKMGGFNPSDPIGPCGFEW